MKAQRTLPMQITNFPPLDSTPRFFFAFMIATICKSNELNKFELSEIYALLEKVYKNELRELFKKRGF